jgi:spore coat polysaccharide biosynthesis protein SpsF
LITPKIGIGLQSRLNSQRLPGKALLPLGSTLVLNQVMRRLKCLTASHFGLLTDQQSAPQFLPIAHKEGFDCIVGDPEDVLDRYYRYSKANGLDLIIRATGDNPLVFVSYVPDFINQLRQLPTLPDYATMRGLPYGAGLEFIGAKALETAWTNSTSHYHREHVCPYLYEHPQDFLLFFADAPKHLKGEDVRITLDTQDDYLFLQRLFNVTQIEDPGTDQLVIQCARALTQSSHNMQGRIDESSC